jgi:hypothetical protein
MSNDTVQKPHARGSDIAAAFQVRDGAIARIIVSLDKAGLRHEEL